MTAAMRLLGARPHAWTPASLPNVVAWWDAADAGSFTFSSGTVVSSWASRVGSYALGNATAGARPARSATVNGRAAVDFNAGKALSVASFDLSAGGQKFSLWAVCSAASGGDRVIAEHTANFNGNPGAFLAFRDASAKAILSKKGAPLYSTVITTGTLLTTPKAFIGTHDGTQTLVESHGWLNGSPDAAAPSDTNSNNLSATLHVGARAGSSLFLNGLICELGICSVVLGATDRAKLETYLSAKWGLGF